MTSHHTEPPLLETLSVVDCVLRQLGRRLPAHVSREDLASAGKVALVEALMRFDGPANEAQPYCHTRVRGAMLDPLSRRTRTRVKPATRAPPDLPGRLGRDPADFEVAAETGLTIGAVREANRFATVDEIPLDGAADGMRLELPDPAATCPAESAARDDTASSVQAALARLRRLRSRRTSNASCPSGSARSSPPTRWSCASAPAAPRTSTTSGTNCWWQPTLGRQGR